MDHCGYYYLSPKLPPLINFIETISFDKDISIIFHNINSILHFLSLEFKMS